MNTRATHRETVLDAAERLLTHLESRIGDGLVAGTAVAESIAPEHVRRQKDIVANHLVAALDYARVESELLEVDSEAVAASSSNIPYIPSNQTLALVQSALDEYLETRAVDTAGAPVPAEAFDPDDPGWLSVAWEKLKALLRGKHPFVTHQGDVTKFREPFPNRAVVALFSDWGTGEETAKRVMRQIKAAAPTHAIHLGDVYYSGTEHEIRTRFLGIIDEAGPAIGPCQYRALNSNHEMYSGGWAYFDVTLRRFNQPASYFNLQNDHWQLVGLDSGYEDHGLKDPQQDWLTAQLQQRGTRRSLLLTHHQLFSPFEERAFDRKLHKKTTALLPSVYGWFWGHEHKAIIFGDHQGIKARCIGHGAIPGTVPYGNPKFPEIPVMRIDERPVPGTHETTHGFALLTFDGPGLSVKYIDEFGVTWFEEQL